MKYNKWSGLNQRSRTYTIDYPPNDEGVPSCGQPDRKPTTTSRTSTVPSSYDESLVYYVPEKSVTSYVKRPPKDNQSFRKIRESGIIKMTDYEIGKTETEYYLTGNMPYDSNAKSTWSWRSCGSGDDIRYNIVPQQWLWTTSQRRYSLADPWIQGLNHYKAEDVPNSLQKRIESVKSEVVADTIATVDLLTEVAEARKSLQLILTAVRAVKRPLQTFERMRKEILQARKSGSINEYKRRQAAYANAWMQGRYGMMPLIYSVQDALQLYEEARYKYMTKRSGDGYTRTGSTRPKSVSSSMDFIYDLYDITHTIKGTGKVCYDLPALRVADQTGFNFVTTAWELFPASFVADWFANIGEWAAAQTSTMVDLSSQRQFCYSVKTESLVTSVLSIHPRYQTSSTMTTPPPLAGTYPLDVDRGRMEQDLKRVIVEDYKRFTFSPSDVELHWNPDLTDWRKWVDFMSISLNSGSKQLRNLRL